MSVEQYDTTAQLARIEAIMSFLDLNTHQWDQWLTTLNPDQPPQIVKDFETEIVDVIHSLRHTEEPGTEARYIRAVATMTTSAINWFVSEVGKFHANWAADNGE